MIDVTPKETFEEAAASNPTVIYVAGLAYSGTTLFASALGHSDNIFNGGEINYVENDYHREKNCSCGEKIDRCSLWKPLLTNLSNEAASGESVLNFSPDQRLRPIDSRDRSTWQKIKLVMGVPPENIFGTSEIVDYVERHTNFFQSLSKQTGSNFIVDASKSFARLDILHRYCDLPIHVIFLRRSPIQSYASRLKRAKKRNRFYISAFAPIYLAVLFATAFASYRQLKRIPRKNITFVDYETFVQNPVSVQNELTRLLKTDVDFGIQDNVVPIGHLHVFTGNVWLPRAVQKGEAVKLRLGDGKSSLSRFETLTFHVLSPIAKLLKYD